MKHFLADTHALLFFFSQPDRLGRAARRAFDGWGARAPFTCPQSPFGKPPSFTRRGTCVYLLLLGLVRCARPGAGIALEALLAGDVEEARALPHLADPFDRLIAGTALSSACSHQQG